jgi:hypothetical protein
MLRTLVLLLLLANLLFFGWARGWFAPGWPAPRAAEREPERLAEQVRPELIEVLSPAAASAAVAAARAAAAVCLEAGPYDAVGVVAAEAVLLAAGLSEGSWERQAAAPPSRQFWLRVPRADGVVQTRLAALVPPYRPCEVR